MIVDDEEFADDLAFLLDGPYEYRMVSRSGEGIELPERARFDPVLPDPDMPCHCAPTDGGKGPELLTRIRARP